MKKPLQVVVEVLCMDNYYYHRPIGDRHAGRRPIGDWHASPETYMHPRRPTCLIKDQHAMEIDMPDRRPIGDYIPYRLPICLVGDPY